MTTKREAVREAIKKALEPGHNDSDAHAIDCSMSREFTLEDVLRAMKSNAQLMRWATTELRFEDGKVEFGYNDHADECSYMHWYEWTLGLPLDQQPEPVIDFLYDLLANTETV